MEPFLWWAQTDCKVFSWKWFQWTRQWHDSWANTVICPLLSVASRSWWCRGIFFYTVTNMMFPVNQTLLLSLINYITAQCTVMKYLNRSLNDKLKKPLLTVFVSPVLWLSGGPQHFCLEFLWQDLVVNNLSWHSLANSFLICDVNISNLHCSNSLFQLWLNSFWLKYWIWQVYMYQEHNGIQDWIDLIML